MSLIVKIGGRFTPLATSPSDPLTVLDPSISEICAALKTHVPPMLGALQASLPSFLSSVVSMAIPHRPTVTQMTTALSLPLIAIWRDGSEVHNVTSSSISITSDIVIAYVMPALTDIEQSKFAGFREFVAACIISLLSVNSTSISTPLLGEGTRIDVNKVEYGTFATETGIELPSALIKCNLVEAWEYHGFTTDADSPTGIDYTINTETFPALVEGSQTFGD